MSIDGTSNTLEYIRYPVKYETVKKNIITLSKLDITDLNVNYCIQALNVNNLKNSIDFFEKPALELCFGDSSTLKSALIAVLIAPRIRT